MKMDRILLKMSGEALAGDKKHGFDEETVRDVSNQVKQIVDKGIQEETSGEEEPQTTWTELRRIP